MEFQRNYPHLPLITHSNPTNRFFFYPPTPPPPFPTPGAAQPHPAPDQPHPAASIPHARRRPRPPAPPPPGSSAPPPTTPHARRRPRPPPPTKHVKQKRKAYHDGALVFHPASGRLVLVDDAGDTVDSRFLRADEAVSTGASLAFHSHLVDVGEPQTRSTSYSASYTAAASRTAHRGVARVRPSAVNPRPPRAFVNPPKSCGGSGGKAESVGFGGAEVADSRLQEWSVLYTTQLTQKSKKYHDGVVRLVQIGSRAKQIVLLDEEGKVLGSRYLKLGEPVESGKKCHFPNYLIEIGEPENQRKGVEPNSSEESMVETRPKSGENTSNKMGFGATSKSMEFTSPQNFHDLEESKLEVTPSSNKPETGKIEVAAASSRESLRGSTNSGFKEWSALYTTQLTQKAMKWQILYKMPPYSMLTQKKIVAATMVLHNFIREHASGDVDFANFDRDPNYVPTIPERYNKYDVSQHASDGSTSESSFVTMDSFRDSLATSVALAWN